MKTILPFLLGGLLFGAGLQYSGMAQPRVVLDFLVLDDLGLLFVLGTALVITLPVYQLWKKPLFAACARPFAAPLDRQAFVGSILFGVGWGISGVCPGAVFAGLGAGNLPLLVALATMLLGSYVQGRLFDWLSRSAPAPAALD